MGGTSRAAVVGPCVAALGSAGGSLLTVGFAETSLADSPTRDGRMGTS